MSFPATRMRRLRATESLRALVRETSLTPASLVAPLFVCHGERVSRPIASMPGHAQMSVDLVVEKAKKLASLGVGGLILFGIPAKKDPEGREAYDPQGIVARAFRAIKSAEPELSRPARHLECPELWNCVWTVNWIESSTIRA